MELVGLMDEIVKLFTSLSGLGTVGLVIGGVVFVAWTAFKIWDWWTKGQREKAEAASDTQKNRDGAFKDQDREAAELGRDNQKSYEDVRKEAGKS